MSIINLKNNIKIMDKSNYFLKGERVLLRPIEADEVQKISHIFVKWFNDGAVTYYMFTGQKPQNAKQIAEQINKDLSLGDAAIFLAVDIKTKKMIGYAGLYAVHPTAKKAEFRILIGEKDFRGRGYGTEVTELLTFYGFDRLNLHRIYLGFTADNKAANEAYEKAGYVYEGALKDDIYRNSRYYDSVRMAILRDDYYKKFYPAHLKRFGNKN